MTVTDRVCVRRKTAPISLLCSIVFFLQPLVVVWCLAPPKYKNAFTVWMLKMTLNWCLFILQTPEGLSQLAHWYQPQLRLFPCIHYKMSVLISQGDWILIFGCFRHLSKGLHLLRPQRTSVKLLEHVSIKGTMFPLTGNILTVQKHVGMGCICLRDFRIWWKSFWQCILASLRSMLMLERIYKQQRECNLLLPGNNWNISSPILPLQLGDQIQWFSL